MTFFAKSGSQPPLLLVQTNVQTHANAHELPSAHATETLVIVTNDYPPYAHADADGSFLPDLFDAIGHEMNVTFEFHFKPWKRGEQDVENLEAWGTLPYRRTEERARKFNFSDALYIEDSRFSPITQRVANRPFTMKNSLISNPTALAGYRDIIISHGSKKPGFPSNMP